MSTIVGGGRLGAGTDSTLASLDVFNEYMPYERIEVEAQESEKFNQASNGALSLTTRRIAGNVLNVPVWKNIANLVTFVDANKSETVNEVDVSMYNEKKVKVTTATPPVRIDEIGMDWINSPQAAGTLFGRLVGMAMVKEKVNAMIGSAVAAIRSVPDLNLKFVGNKKDASAGKPPTIKNLLAAESKMGDHGIADIVTYVMHSQSWYAFLQNNAENYIELFTYPGLAVMMSPTGKSIIVTDSPDLVKTETVESTSVTTYYTLLLQSMAVTMEDQGTFRINDDTRNGFTTPRQTFQGWGTHVLGVKGYGWDETNGGVSPDKSEFTKVGNWDKVATSNKHTAGVLMQNFFDLTS